MKPRTVATHFHHRFYRYIRMMLRRYPHRACHPMMLVAAMGNQSCRALVAAAYPDWRQRFMDEAAKVGKHITIGTTKGVAVAMDGARAYLDRAAGVKR